MNPHVVPTGQGLPSIAVKGGETLLSAATSPANSSQIELPLEFGTAGVRAIVGAAPDQLNIESVTPYFEGHSRYLRAAMHGERPLIIIGFDARECDIPELKMPLRSSDIAARAADIYARGSADVLMFDSMVPTPLIPFAVKKFGAAAGIVITASHNPPEYNGIKFYDSTATQISSAAATGVSEYIAECIQERGAGSKPKPAPDVPGKIGHVSETIIAEYINATRFVRQDKSARTTGTPFAALLTERPQIVYTPMQGVGGNCALTIFADEGYLRSDIHPVIDQFSPDGSFRGVTTPNPEDPRGFDKAIVLAKSISADLIVATDPDADRLAVAARNSRGDYIVLSGTQVGAIIGHYILAGHKERGELNPEKDFMLTTFVSSNFLPAVARLFNVNCLQTYVGFKWICEASAGKEREGGRFLFGYEQAIGYAIGNLIPDKDGLSALRLMAELAAKCHSRGTTVLEYLYDIYRQTGLYMSIEKGLKLGSLAENNSLMQRLRRGAPQAIAGNKLLGVLDFRKDEDRAAADNPGSPLGLPSYELMQFEYSNRLIVQVRPSGTEPKVKFYAHSVAGNSGGSIGHRYHHEMGNLQSALGEFIGQLGH